jgi:2-polyprenyl-6-methoxyphenol hydroxylase-like FAD-dependent oxidoreductase
MSASLRVGIVGCGTAGPALGLFLTRAGHAVTVFEQVDRPTTVGAGLLLQPTGMAVLSRLGLLEGVLESGSRIRRLFGITPSGRVVMDLRYAELQPDLFGLGVHRGVLFGSLFDSLRESGVRVRCGVRITSTRREGARRMLVDEGGAEFGPFDLVVVADGARSHLRGETALTKRSRPYEWSALWFIGKDAGEAFGGELFQVYKGTRRFIGFLATGRGPEGPEPLVSIFWSIRKSRVGALRDAGLEAWKDEVRTLTDRADPILDQIHDLDQLIHAVYHDAVMRRWHDDAIVYIGDAAHAMSPQLGQGVNLALYDAMVLADCLDGPGDLGAALDRYGRARRGHVAFYQYASRWLLPLFQSNWVWMGPLRDGFVRPISRLPWFRRHALASMAGTKDGWLSRMDLGPLTEYLRRP